MMSSTAFSTRSAVRLRPAGERADRDPRRDERARRDCEARHGIAELQSAACRRDWLRWASRHGSTTALRTEQVDVDVAEIKMTGRWPTDTPTTAFVEDPAMRRHVQVPGGGLHHRQLRPRRRRSVCCLATALPCEPTPPRPPARSRRRPCGGLVRRSPASSWHGSPAFRSSRASRSGPVMCS